MTATFEMKVCIFRYLWDMIAIFEMKVYIFRLATRLLQIRKHMKVYI